MELMCSTKTDTFWQCTGKEILFGFSYLHLVMKGRFGLKTVKTFGSRVRVAIQYNGIFFTLKPIGPKKTKSNRSEYI